MKKKLYAVGQFLIGLVFGFLTMVSILPILGDNFSLPELALAFILFIPALVLHIIYHEAGHAVFGRITGYRLVSFRIFSVMWIATPDGIKRKKRKVPGTLGQCIMLPPAGDDYESMPFALYHAGGGLFNILLSAICVAPALLIDIKFVRIFFAIMIICGLFLAATNLIPNGKDAPVTNDGYNLMILTRHPETRRPCCMSLIIAEQLGKDVRLKDIDKSYLELPESADMTLHFNQWMLYYRAEAALDEMKLDESRSLYRELSELPELCSICEIESKSALFFYECINERRPEEIERLLDTKLQNNLKAMSKISLAKIRVLYAYNKFYKHNEQRAQERRNQFDKMTQNYFAPAELESELEIMAYLDTLEPSIAEV